MNTKDILIAFATRIDRLRIEIYTISKDKNIAMTASHTLVTVAALMEISARRLYQLANKV